MKKLAFFSVAIFLLSFAVLVYAHDTDANARSDRTYKDTDLVGLNVQNQQGETLGKINNMAVDPQMGRIPFAVIQYGGFFGFGGKYVAVPLSAMDLRTDENGRPKMFVLNASKDQFAKAPSFEGNAWPDMKQVDESYRYFGQTPYWTDRTERGEREHGISIKIH
jgi:sporulation protein YlmC with PRC-barrel domain